MTQASDYALLAASAYDDIRLREKNRSPIPADWTELTEYAISGSGTQATIGGSGFSAKVYQSTSGEIVISLAGTEFDASIGGVVDWTSGNVPLAVGSRSAQALEAARLYERIKADIGGDNITFTGHSLGGGLAGLMAVWFDRPAKVFAPAPFELAATRSDASSTLDFVRSKLAASALGVDPKLASYEPFTHFAAREANVEAWAVKGEVLEAYGEGLLNWIEASGRHPLFDAGPTELGVIAKHSVDLHAAGLLSTSFNTWAAKLTTALPRIFDSGLYGFGPMGRDEDFLVRLNRGEVGVAGVAPDGRLTHFAADLQKLGTNVECLTRAAQDAILAQGIEWYYWQGSAYAGQEFFTQTGQLLQYTTAVGDGLAGALNKADSYVRTWLTSVIAVEGPYSGSLNFAQWSLNTGDQAVTAGARDAGKDQILIGRAAADNFTGGNLADLLLASGGDDTLNGGRGDDTLMGGQGWDTYSFGAEFGNDVVIDSDGSGVLIDLGTQITGGKKAPGLSSTWEDDTRQYVFTKIAKPDGSADLVISKRAAPGVGTVVGAITVRNWQDGQLGIVLSNDTLATAPIINTFDGGFIKKLKADGVSYEIVASGYVYDGVDPAVQDLLFGAADTDKLSGGDGNDGLAGFAGDDEVDGGAGDDLILGGAGGDRILGGAGNDHIFGSGGGGFVAPQKTTDAPPVANGAVLARGFGWVAYSAPGQGAGGADAVKYVNAGILPVLADASNYIDAGAGDDSVAAGTGSDVVFGGDDNDEIYGMAGADVLFGDAGADKLFGDGVSDAQAGQLAAPQDHADDVLFGGGGNDDLVGQGGDDQLYGGENNDRLFGDQNKSTNGLVDDTPVAFHGDDFLDGGTGDDYLEGDGGGDVLVGGEGSDQLWGDAIPDRLAAAAHDDDQLDGGAGADTLIGGGGNDTLLGGDGNDSLAGDEESSTSLDLAAHGGDYLDGGAGDDVLFGNGGSDSLYGGSGDDSLSGGRGNDMLFGGDGIDQVRGDEASLAGQFHGNDVLDGESGNDVMVGGGGNDTVFGGDGADQLSGDDDLTQLAAQWHGNDTLDGGVGNDIVFGNGGDDTLHGGDGDDWLAGEDQISVAASSTLVGNDMLNGGAGNDVLIGGKGDDLLDGGSGDDALYGGDGSDTLISGSGSDVLEGGAGDDIYVVNGAEASVVNGTTTLVLDRVSSLQGNDSMVLAGVNSAEAMVERDGTGTVKISSTYSGVGIEGGLTSQVGSIRLDDGVTSLRRLVNDKLQSSVVLSSGGQGGSLLGGALGDTLTVNAGADQNLVSAGRGNDTIRIDATGGATLQVARGDGTDTLTAAARVGTDARNVLLLDEGIAPADVRLVWRSNGWHVLSLGAGDGLTFQVGGWANASAVPSSAWPVDEIRFADGTVNTMADVIARGVYMLPNATPGDDVVSLTPVSDTFDGLGGNDWIDGGDGDDLLYGGAGDDTLVGSSGNDTLEGGSGYDRLEGGAGNDTYRITYYSGTAFDAAASDDTYAVGSWLASANYSFYRIEDAGGYDTLASITGVAPDSIVVTNTGSDLIIRSGGTNYQNGLWIVGAVGLDGNIDASHMVERMTFASGQVWNATDIVARSLRTTGGDDQVLGYGADETIDGGAGSDTLAGAGGNDDLRGGSSVDFLDGGAGNDTLRAGAGGGSLTGGLGDDLFVVQSGEGSVYIKDLISSPASALGNDTVQVGVARSAVTVSAQIKDRWSYSTLPDTLTLSWNDGSTTLSIALLGALSADPANGRIEFADGTISSVAALLAPYLPIATQGADSLGGSSLDDSIFGLGGDDYILGLAGSDQLFGGAGDDTLVGGAGNDLLSGGAGNDDLMFDGDGDDTVILGLGDGSDSIYSSANSGDAEGVKSLTLGAEVAAQDVEVRWISWHDGSGTEDQLRLRVVATGESLTWGRAQGDALASDYESSELVIDRVNFGGGVTWDQLEILARANASTSGDDIQIGGQQADTLAGGAGADVLQGMQGDDVLAGDAGDDQLFGREGNDRLTGGTGDDWLDGGQGTNVAVYGRGDGDDTIVNYQGPSIGTTNIEFGVGLSPVEVVGRRSDFAGGSYHHGAILGIVGGGSITLASSDGRSTDLPEGVSFADGTVWDRNALATLFLTGGVDDDALMGFRDTGDLMVGGDGGDVMWGLAGSDTLLGGDGNDKLYAVGGAAGYSDGIGSSADADLLIGGAGDDELHAGDGHVTYRFDIGFGHDVIKWSSDRDGGKDGVVSFGSGIAPGEVVVRRVPWGQLAIDVGLHGSILVEDAFSGRRAVTRIEFANNTSWTYEDMVARISPLPSSGSDELLGTPAADSIDALDGNDVVYGYAGNDQLVGSGGNDVLRGGTGDDLLNGGDGADQLEGEEGNDTLMGGAGDDLLYGGSGSDTLVGGEGDDYLSPGGGIDVAEGGAGNDTIAATADAEVFRYSAGWGQDSITSLVGADVLRFDATVAPSALQLWRHIYDHLLIEHPSSGSTTLVNWFFGGGPSPTGLTFDFNGSTSWDLSTIQSQVLGLIGTDNNDTIASPTTGGPVRGLGGNDTLNGSASADTLDGGTGNDKLAGGAGDDIYIVDAAGDTTIEGSNAGTDTVRSTLGWTLSSNVENLELTGTAAINGTGNSLANRVTGNGAANVLSGGSGADTLIGGTGDDTYVVDNTGDTANELAGEGMDLVQSSVTWTLAANIERLTLTGTTAINGTGNATNNVITGNSGANVLNGGAGDDTMAGGAGNDTYVVDSSGDVVTEGASAGTDLVQSGASYTLSANVENLTLTGTAGINGTGNTLGNSLTGNSGNNVLDGSAGNDTLVGGAGNDTYVVDSASDVVTEAASAGTDTVLSSVTLTLAANAENLTLTGTSAINGTGNTLANVLTGNAAANTLSGGTGNDTMSGGAGDDTYVVDATGDAIAENASEGIDLVQSGVTYTLAVNVENLTLTGTSAINGTGNSLDNALTGNSGNNTLTGGAGNDTLDGGSGTDTMIGGAGNDTYVLNVSADVVTENANEGVDTVRSAVTLTLGSNVENLTLTGTSTINGTGNALSNVLAGNTANNTLTAAAGNDTLDGGAGNDTLNGGTGNDTYVLAAGAGADTVSENDATAGNTDVLSIGVGIAAEQIWFRQVGSNLEVSIIGTSDKSTISNWYGGSAYHVEQFKTAGGRTLLDSQVQALVSAMAAFAPPAAGQTTLPPNYQVALNPVIASSWT